uniref:G-protein coupled receptors family 1 profile domain-containing protein n=1 Tax=Oryzias latipes TaxID=8090 RepID=A0A3P9I523_ORYLA
MNGVPNNTNHQNCNISDGNWTFTVVPVYVMTIAVVGIVLNFFVLMVFILHKKACTVAEIYLSNLAAADLLLVSFLPFWAVNVYRYYNWTFGVVLCKTVNVSILMNVYCSIFFLVLVSIDRYFALVFPLSHAKLRRPVYAKVACFLVWVAGFLLSLPALIHREVITRLESNSTFCSVNPASTTTIIDSLRNRIVEGINSQKKDHKATTLVLAVLFYVGSGLLCCISVDRYLAIVYPFYFHWVREVCTAVALSTAVCILEVVLHTLLLFHMGALQGSLCLYEQHIPIKPEAALVFLVRIIVGFLIPVIIMSFCFQQIMQSLNQSVSILEEERRRVHLLLLLLLLTYIASFLPYQTVMLLRALLEPGSCKWATQLRGAYFVTSALTTLNSTLDPILYCLINTSARMEIKIFAGKGRKCFMKEDMELPRSSTQVQSSGSTLSLIKTVT